MYVKLFVWTFVKKLKTQAQTLKSRHFLKFEKSEGNKAKKLRAVCVEFDTKEKFISSHPPPPPVLV